MSKESKKEETVREIIKAFSYCGQVSCFNDCAKTNKP